MKVVKSWEREEVTINEPYKRTLKVLFAPDKENVEELTFTLVLLHPHSQTDYHMHDRPELMYIISGEGLMIGKDTTYEMRPDMAFWVPKNEMHQMKNTNDYEMKFVSAFIPAFSAHDIYQRCIEAAKKNPQ